MSLQIKIDLKEIARFLCKKCRAKLKQYLKEKVAEAISENMLNIDKMVGGVKNDADS